MKKMYVVRDRDAQDWVGAVVWLLHGDVVALRMFTDLCRNPQTDMHKHPDSFELVRVGTLSPDEITDTEVSVIARASDIAQADRAEARN